MSVGTLYLMYTHRHRAKEKAIRSLPEVASRPGILTRPADLIASNTKSRFYKRYVKRHQKRLIRYGLLALNILVLGAVTLFVVKNPNNSQAVSSSVTSINRNTTASNPLDRLSSADIAVSVARMTNLPEERAVTNNADTINTQLSLAPADDTVIAKPQVVNTAAKTNKDIRKYVVQTGDTVNSLADRFAVPSDAIRWSNNIAANTLTVGKEILIPPDGTNAIVYLVKNGDSPDGLAQRYRTNKDLIIAINDAEIAGLKVGTYILVPNGVVVPPSQATPTFFAAAYAGNGYDYGYCTWWAATRRSQVGHPIPSNLGNASTWKIRAILAGIPTGSVPKPGAVIWSVPRDYYGHVGYVESVAEDGSVNVSEMNVVGWNRVSYRTLTPAEAANYSYIYW